jgi:hypothetical protein
VATHLFMSFLNAKPGRDAEFKEWYSKTHIPEVLQIPGFMGAKRFRVSGSQLPGMSPPWQYMVVYEIEGTSPATALEELSRRIANGMNLSDSFQPDLAAWAYSPQDALD